MSNLVMWNLIVGFLVPNLVAIVQQPKFSQNARAVVTFVCCVLFGAGTAYFNNQFNLGDIVGSILVTAVAAITFYKGLWKPTGVAPKIEQATSSSTAVRNHRGSIMNFPVLVYGALFSIVLACVLVVQYLQHR